MEASRLSVPDESVVAGPAATSQFLTFILDGEEYGIDILQVQCIQGWDRATPIPNTPDYVLGVINLRGAIVPIIELRRRLEMVSKPFDSTTVVIVLKVSMQGKDCTIGIVVDAVSEVYNIAEDALQQAPDFGDPQRLRVCCGARCRDSTHSSGQKF